MVLSYRKLIETLWARFNDTRMNTVHLTRDEFATLDNLMDDYEFGNDDP